MSWFSNMFSWNKKPSGQATTTPSDPEAPIKGLMKNAPQSTGNSNIDANMKMKRELLGSFKKGGKVKKTGPYQLHEGEFVLNKKKALAMKMDKNDSDNLREFSRFSPDSQKPLYKMPEGTYKRVGDRYVKSEQPNRGVVHD